MMWDVPVAPVNSFLSVILQAWAILTNKLVLLEVVFVVKPCGEWSWENIDWETDLLSHIDEDPILLGYDTVSSSPTGLLDSEDEGMAIYLQCK